MRTPRTLAALFALVVLSGISARAQIKTDLGASATAGSGASAAAGSASFNNTGALAVPALNAGLAPSILAAAPVANLAPAARIEAAGLPASALVAAPAASVHAGEAPQAPKAAAAAAVAPAPPGNPGSAASPAAPPAGPPIVFVKALQDLGVSAELTDRLVEFLSTRHPGRQDGIYHGLGHSNEVANYTARVVAGADLPAARKILLIFAASLHDIDPERVPDTPARVAATIKYLDEDPAAGALIADFSSRFGFTPAQVGALILATDFSPDPAEMKSRQQIAAMAAAANFPGEDFGLVWGRRLAFVDQSSTYLGGVDNAKKRVEGLATEIRTQLGVMGKGPGPTDAQLLAGTGKFLSVLRQDPNFAFLPADLQKQFDTVQSYFDARQTPDAWAAAAAPAPARAPPDVAAAQRYVRSIAAGFKLNESQTDGLLQQFFEEQGISPTSARADAVRRQLIPSKFAAEDKAVAALSPSLRRHRAVLLKLAAERETTPAAIEAVLTQADVLATIAGLGDAAFETQAEFALRRDELNRAVARYPDNEQGRFMRNVANDMATSSGKSVEELARDGVFAYVDFAGSTVRSAASGRDPDVSSVQVVFYVTRREGRWRIGGYRQNRASGRSDAELSRALKNWLVAGGVPTRDLE